ncbi:hypothetical protein [Enterobacter ludwigii]
MLGGCKSEAKLKSKLKSWSHLKNNCVLAHTIRGDYLNSSELLNRNAEDVFSTWDVISASYVNLNKIIPLERSIVAPLRRATGFFGELTFVLDVHPQNILGTHAHDVWFPNHAGIETKNTYALVDSILSGKGKEHKLAVKNWPMQSGKNYNHIMKPDELLQKTKYGSYNEVLLIGRPNVNIYPGFKPTKKIKVKEIIYISKKGSTYDLDIIKLNELFSRLRGLNPQASVSYF